MSIRRMALSILVGVPLALVVTEMVCIVVSGGAFPHVNFYVPDATLGVRLAPSASERISFSDNPITQIRTNSIGFRGGEWLASDAPTVLVVGDSQAFGLGVEEGETAAAVIAERTGRVVINGGVPTYGPDEYLAVAREIGATRTLSDLVVILNASNDFFEAGRPNTERHGVWDGWAVRKENMPEAGPAFPGRSWLLARSHAVFAFRAWRYGDAAPEAVPSEGSAADLLPLADADGEARLADAAATHTAEAEIAAGVQQAILAASRPDAEEDMLMALSYADNALQRGDFRIAAAVASLRGKAVGDVVYEPFAESSRHITLTAETLEAGAKLRREAPERLRRWLATNPERDHAVRQAREALRRMEIAAGKASVPADQVAPLPAPRSALSKFLTDALAVAAAEGARLTLVLLPLDVQVSAEEWKKYGAEPIDMTGSLTLMDEVAREADSRGISVVEPLEVLRAAEPGAFLHGDIHLSPRGQRTLGEAIAASLTGPVPAGMPGAGLPEGRSRVPLAIEWVGLREVVVTGSTALHCGTWQVREWVKVRCDGQDVEGITLLEAPLESMVARVPSRAPSGVPAEAGSGSMTLISPRLAGRPIAAHFRWKDHASRLVIDDEGRRFEATDGDPPAPSQAPSPDACALPDDWVGRLDRGCDQLEACADRLACADGQRLALPHCGVGQANAGAAGHCYDRCDDAHACSAGICTPWQGGAICL